MERVFTVDGADDVEVKTLASESAMPRLFKRIPSHYNTSYFQFLRLVVVGYLAYLASTVAAPYVSISPFVLCLLFGVIASSMGFWRGNRYRKRTVLVSLSWH